MYLIPKTSLPSTEIEPVAVHGKLQRASRSKAHRRATTLVERLAQARRSIPYERGVTIILVKKPRFERAVQTQVPHGAIKIVHNELVAAPAQSAGKFLAILQVAVARKAKRVPETATQWAHGICTPVCKAALHGSLPKCKQLFQANRA